MKIIIDEDTDKVYVGIHDDPIRTEVTHTLEKHGILMHWNGHGKLMGVEFTNPDHGEIIGLRYGASIPGGRSY